MPPFTIPPPRPQRIIPLIVLGFLLCPTLAAAHPVPRDFYDRKIEVTVKPDGVYVHYRLEIDPLTLYQDLPYIVDTKKFDAINKPDQAYRFFVEACGPILANNLAATLSGDLLDFKCTKAVYSLKDDKEEPLGHVRCDFVFEAPWKLAPGKPAPFAFREGNYLEERGGIDVSLSADPSLLLTDIKEPPAALKKKSAIDLRPGDSARLRQVNATVTLPGEILADANPQQVFKPFVTRLEPVLFLLLAMVLGPLGALAPENRPEGVRSVGQVLRGTVAAFASTAVILLVAFVNALVPKPTMTQSMFVFSGTVSGGVFFLLGFWLFLRRWGGDGEAPGGRLHWIPSPGAVLLLAIGVCYQEPWLTLAALLVLGISMATVLMVAGILDLTGKAVSHPDVIPVVSAALITFIGLWLSYHSLNWNVG